MIPISPFKQSVAQARQTSGGSLEATEAYCCELLAASFSQSVVPVALSSSDPAADNALAAVVGTLSSLSKQGTLLLQLQALLHDGCPITYVGIR